MKCLGLLVVGESMRQGRGLMDNLFCARFLFLFSKHNSGTSCTRMG